KRPADLSQGHAYQTVSYDVLGRETFQSEWLWQNQTTCGSTGKPVSACGTILDYHDPDTASPSNLTDGEFDPFGRVRRVIPVDGNISTNDKVTRTDYSGQNSTVTVYGVQGTSGPMNTVTTYNRDGWGRLLEVVTPSSGGA